MPYCITGSSIKFQGHTGWKIDSFNPVWVRLLGQSQLSNPSDLPCCISTSICFLHLVTLIFLLLLWLLTRCGPVALYGNIVWISFVSGDGSCLMSPSHYLSQCRLIVRGVLWHSLWTNFTGNTQDINPWNKFEKHTHGITFTSPRGSELSLGHNPPCTSLQRVCIGFGSRNAENRTVDTRRRCMFWETQEHVESTQRLLNSVQ